MSADHAAQLAAMDADIVARSLAALREEAQRRDWEAMEQVMAERLPRLCRDAVEAALWGRVRLRLLREEWA